MLDIERIAQGYWPQFQNPNPTIYIYDKSTHSDQLKLDTNTNITLPTKKDLCT